MSHLHLVLGTGLEMVTNQVSEFGRMFSVNNLIDDTPEAGAYVREAKSRYSGRPGISQVCSAVLWTSTPVEGEVLGGDDPAPLVEGINSFGLPIDSPTQDGVEHSYTNPTGWVFECRLFFAPSGDGFVVGILGFFDLGYAKSLEVEAAYPFDPEIRDVASLIKSAHLSIHHREFDPNEFVDVLRDAPIAVDPDIRYEYRHAAGGDAVLRHLVVWVPIAFVLKAFFASAAEVWGTAFGEMTLGWANWVKTKVLPKFSDVASAGELQPTLPRLEWRTDWEGCQVSFVAESSDLVVLESAFSALPEFANRVHMTHRRFLRLKKPLYRIVAIYDVAAGRWVVSNAITMDGELWLGDGPIAPRDPTVLGLSLAGSYQHFPPGVASLAPEDVGARAPKGPTK